ncbi:MAG: acyl-CoA dehydrogenase family protein [Actinomycetota bacterium]
MTLPDLTDAQREARAAARDFAAREVAPHADAWHRDGRVPVEAIRALGTAGFLGMTVPREYGGGGVDAVTAALVTEEVARADAGLAVALMVQTGLVAGPIAGHGTAAQKARWLPRLATGELIGAYALTEPGTGSDTAALATAAVQDGGGAFRITGAKMWISNGGLAGLFIVFARTDGPGARGVSALLTEPGPGLVVGRELPKMGLHTSSTVELAFDGALVAPDGLLGRRGEGLRIALRALDGGRIAVAAQACGIAQAALDVAVDYARERQAFGGPIARFQGVQFPIADVAARLHAARLAMLHAARLRDAGRPHGVEAAMAKLLASGVAVAAAGTAVQTLGGNGCSAEYRAERLYRDAKVTEIYEGTSQIQRLLIARGLLGDAARG